MPACVPLSQFTEPPEMIVQECIQQIEIHASGEEKANLLAVTLIMNRFRYNNPDLLKILRGSKAMESPLIVKLLAYPPQDDIIQNLETRFGAAPPEVALQLRAIQDDKQLGELQRQAVLCSNCEVFRKILES